MLLILAILKLVISNHTECMVAMKEYFDLPEIAQWALSYRQIEMSGTWANKFGFYDYCLGDENHYSSVNVIASPLNFMYGFCHTNICDANDFNSDEGQQLIKEHLNNGIISKLLNIDFSMSSLKFYNPLTYYPDFNIGSYLTILLIFTLVILGCLDPIFKMMGNNKNQLLIQQFSIINNYKKLLNLKTIDPKLAIFNGIRAVAFMMVVFGHATQLIVGSTYQMELLTFLQEWKIIVAIDMLYSVDIFFWIGGFFMAYVMCDPKRSKQLKQNPFSIFMVILHRILRIWPCYIICIMINSYLLPFVGEGPRWWQVQNYTGCEAGAWRNLLFIDNFFYDWKLCFGWGWYLTCDIQLFIICLIPIMIYSYNYKKIAKLSVGLMIILSIIYGIMICFLNNFTLAGKMTTNQDFYYKYYVHSLSRSPPYFFGLLIGIFYRESKQNIGIIYYLSKQSKRIKYFLQFSCYIIGIIIIYWLFFGWKNAFLIQNYWPQWFEEIYGATCRLLFVFGITLLCLPNMIGIYDIFNCKMMNNNLFKFIAKISFACYLLHYMFILILNQSFYVTPTYITMEVIQMFVGCVALTIISATFLTLLVEMPFGSIQNILLVKPQPKRDTLLEQN